MTILKNGTLVTPEGLLNADLAMEGDKITAIGKDLPVSAADKVVDVTGCVVFPGFIDGHTHLDLVNALGHTADNFETGSSVVCLDSECARVFGKQLRIFKENRGFFIDFFRFIKHLKVFKER